jgi:hypothetical protein
MQQYEPRHCITVVVNYCVVFNFLYLLNFISCASNKTCTYFLCLFMWSTPNSAWHRKVGGYLHVGVFLSLTQSASQALTSAITSYQLIILCITLTARSLAFCDASMLTVTAIQWRCKSICTHLTFTCQLHINKLLLQGYHHICLSRGPAFVACYDHTRSTSVSTMLNVYTYSSVAALIICKSRIDLKQTRPPPHSYHSREVK